MSLIGALRMSGFWSETRAGVLRALGCVALSALLLGGGAVGAQEAGTAAARDAPAPAVRGRGAESAGRTVFVRGLVNAEAAGLQRALNPRDFVFKEDTVGAGAKSSARFVMRDRSMLALKPGTRIAISEYHFDPADPAADAMTTQVMEGGLRALTGLIDKRGAQNVGLRTPLATIGVRGTAIRVQLFADGHEEVSFDIGRGWVQNLAGRVEVEEGFTARIVDANTLPEVFPTPPDEKDVAAIAKRLGRMPPGAARDEARLLAGQLPDEDLVLLLAMLDQLPDMTQDLFLDILAGLLEGNRDLAQALLLTAVQLHQDWTPLILRVAVEAGIEVSLALKEVLMAMTVPSEREIELVLIQAVQSGISMEAAQQMVRELREQGLCG